MIILYLIILAAVLVTVTVGLVVTLSSRKKTKCPSCEYIIESEMMEPQYCPECGAKLKR
tara:strand:- start:452 stop:628 length:177 start_codon:yes stop_codon:yes gene_type:complete